MQATPSPPEPPPLDHPVRLRVVDDLRRNRLTVFFRLLLAIPHLIWIGLWGFAAGVVAIVNWFAVLITGRTPDGLHRFLTAFVKYATHLYAYLSISANRYPGFVGDPGYEVDVEFDPPAKQNRWTVLFRLILAVPALLLATALVGSASFSRYASGTHASRSSGFSVSGLLAITAIVIWFYALFRGRAPEGVARLNWYAIHYGAQFWAYLLVLTDRYPSSDPTLLGVPRPPPPHPVVLVEQEDTLVRSRLTVFFRLLLALPHFAWLLLWSIAVVVVAIVNWFATLIMGRSPAAIHNFLASYQRYVTHVYAFVTLVANPFPGFAGQAGSYPVDVDFAPPARQSRWATGFRLILAIPAFLIQAALDAVLNVVAILGWFASLFTGRMPRGLRNLGAFCLRYAAQTSAYSFLLLTDRYPYAGPPAGDPREASETPVPGPVIAEPLF